MSFETNYHIYSDKDKNKESIIETTPNSIKYELPSVTYLKDNDRVEQHPLVNREYTDDDKSYMELMFQYFKQFMYLHRTNSLFKKSKSTNKDRPNFSVSLDGNEKLRCIINNYSRALEMERFCCVGFFGTKSLDCNSTLSEIITSDDALVSALPQFPKILAYVTIQRDLPESEEQLKHLPSTNMINYGNIVIIEDFQVINEWRNFTVHRDANQYLSPLYYHLVRIHNAQIAIPSTSSSFAQYLDSNINEQPEISFIRTKYYSFTPNGKVNFRGLREYKEIKFASFLSSNANGFYSAVVNLIANKLNINIKFIDVYSEMVKDKHHNLSEKPHLLMKRYGIDFAFMCGLSYIIGSYMLEPLASPVRAEEHYKQQPVYYSYLIVRKDSDIDSLESAKNKVFGYNEMESYSGYQIINKYLENNSTIQNYFKKSIKTTSHLKSVESVLNGQVDIASIDSTVYDTELLTRYQELNNNIKIIKTLGPSTMPPLVAKRYSIFYNDYYKEIQDYITSNEFNESLKSILSINNYLKFELVNSTNFNNFK